MNKMKNETESEHRNVTQLEYNQVKLNMKKINKK
jgi:hypothetical protein